MRGFLFWLAILLPVGAHAQATSDAPTSAMAPAWEGRTLLEGVATPVPLLGPPTNRPTGCCSEVARIRTGVGAADRSDAWSNVRDLKVGSRIVVTSRGAPPMRWIFRGADADTLQVASADDVRTPTTLARADIIDIVLETPATRTGILVGVGYDLIVGAIQAVKHEGGAGVTLFGLPGSVVLGGLIGHGFSHDRTIYRP